VRPRWQHITGWNGQTPFAQESPDGDLASKPSLDVSVQFRRAGHHPRNDRSGFEMHKHIAARSHHDCLLAGDGVGESDRPGRRQGTRDCGSLSHVAEGCQNKGLKIFFHAFGRAKLAQAEPPDAVPLSTAGDAGLTLPLPEGAGTAVRVVCVHTLIGVGV
jgi:hypothetical protein